MYHYVRDTGDGAEAGSGIAGLGTADFETQLDLFMRHYALVDWPAVRAHVVGERPLPEGACLLTFDDGLCDHYLNVFPRLRARGLSGLFFAMARAGGGREDAGMAWPHKLHFLLAKLGRDRLRGILDAELEPGPRQRLAEAAASYFGGSKPFALNNPTEALKGALQREVRAEAEAVLAGTFAEHMGDERALAARYYLSEAQAREMAAGGMHFGGHSQAHPWLDFVDDGEAAREAAASSNWLAGLEAGPFAFAYPYGGFDDRTPGHLAAAGFCAAFTTLAQVRHTSAFHIGRLDGECLPPAGTIDAAWLRLAGQHA
jgi:peptidoglycan/xylan/chitin deacetylase (PgdA/CDA1 family)